ncbi:MAG TPA: hypothetical protein PKI51_03275 [Anaerolineaceae bacterium]|nr:hypothetical protein [Anaerolineaceae bacterium]
MKAIFQNSFPMLKMSSFAQTTFSPSPLAIILSVILAVILLGLFIWLLVSGRFGIWLKAALQSSKWTRQDNKLASELKNLARLMNKQHAELGKEAWEARLNHPGYEDAYNKLVGVNEQMVSMKLHLNTLKEESQKVSEERALRNDGFDAQLKQIDDERQSTQSKLEEIKRQHKELNQTLTNLNLERSRIQREIKETRTSIIDIENSEAPNKTALIFPLNSQLEQLSTSLTEVSQKTPALNTELTALETEMQPLNAQLEDLAKTFSQTQILKKQDLSPLDDHLTSLQQAIKKKEEEITALQKTMPDLLAELGAHVDHVRPESLRLSPLYANLDDIHQRTNSATAEKQQLRLTMDKGDKSSVRKFWLFILFAIVVLIAIAIILFFVKPAA